ncbi:uncharacterized protein LOC113217572 isoform X1 [Frankliniella occidentalis]|uniref:Uncharacterized protein LOC113217572 isoform X1 n=1 Tax=Frankliniella occidentalis TaxID=133901 RepID=A0A6J1TKN5_FRAOC|nr:uncharacterized protein LOC113217572 isoform X1 [Frankliniella occidentalis]
MALVLAAVLLALMNQKDGYGKSLNTFAGRYIAYGTKFYNCDQTQLPTSDKPTWNWYLRFTHHFNPLKPEELQRFDGNVTGLEEVNDNCWTRVVVDARSNNQWKENAFVFNFPGGACSAAYQHTKCFQALTGKLLSKGKTCVLNPGVSILSDTPMDWSFPYFPIMPYGEWRFRLSYGPPGQKRASGCHIAEAVTIPKS